MKKVLALFVALSGLQLAAHAQLYSPAADFHDMAQRRFPVEAARVLAWMRNGGKAGISDVSFASETTAAETRWDIEWFQAGKSVRKATVRYPEASLRTGAEWYRLVWKQLTGADWASPKAKPEEIAGPFWDGVESGGITRLEGIDAALKLVAASPNPTGAGAARLSGTLLQSAMPTVGYHVTIDGALLARSAAWLCAAEQQTGAKVAAEWAPLMLLAGRGPEPKQAWEKRPDRQFASWRAWDILIRKPAPGEALNLMAQPENRLYSAPVFGVYGMLDHNYAEIFQGLSKKLYPGPLNPRLQDYSSELNRVMGQAPFLETGPMQFMHDWVELLRGFAPSPGDIANVPEQAAAVHDFDAKFTAAITPSQELVDLVNRGGAKVDGPLIPVAVATATDLLMLGWDLGGLHISSLNHTYAIHPDYKAKRETLRDGWLAKIDGWAAFSASARSSTATPLKDSSRYEFITQGQVAEFMVNQPPTGWPGTPEVWWQRRWLLDVHRAIQFAMAHNGTPKVQADLLRRLIKEADETEVVGLVRNDEIFNSAFGSDPASAKQLREELQRAVPSNTTGLVEMLTSRFNIAADPFGYAQALERAHWNSGLPLAPDVVFVAYIRANAYDSAERFFDRWRESIKTRGNDAKADWTTNAFALAVLRNEADRVLTLQKGGDFFGSLGVALFKEDAAAAAKIIDSQVKRYPNARASGTLASLKDDFLPLLPALKDPKNVDHAKALDLFPKEDYLLLAQWIVYTRANLPAAEAIRFFTAPNMSPSREMVVAALKGDKARFQQIYEREVPMTYDINLNNFGGEGGETILLAYLKNMVLKTPAPKAEPDLMPPDAQPLEKHLRELFKDTPKPKKK